MYLVYKHRSPSNKVYIGITSVGLEKRCKNGTNYRTCPRFFHAIQKYGWENIDHVIIADGLTKEQAEHMEIELIKRYKANDPEFGYNLDGGGKVTCRSEETKRKISQSSKKLWENPDYRERVTVGHIGLKRTEDCKKRQSESAHRRTDNKRAINQYDLSGNFIQSFSGIREAGRKTNIVPTGICKCCKGEFKQYQGYIWAYQAGKSAGDSSSEQGATE